MHTSYLLLKGDRMTEGRKDGKSESLKAEYYVTSCFFQKADDLNSKPLA